MADSLHRDPMLEFADRIVAELERGVKPWVRPWDPEKAGGPQAPFNPVTGRRYHGINVVILGMDMRAFVLFGIVLIATFVASSRPPSGRFCLPSQRECRSPRAGRYSKS